MLTNLVGRFFSVSPRPRVSTSRFLIVLRNRLNDMSQPVPLRFQVFLIVVVMPHFKRNSLHYFESALLRKWGFVLDIEGESHYTDEVEIDYSYRRSHFKYSQWVHRSGVAFVQVMGGSDGFLFLTNRLMAPDRIGTAFKSQRPAAAAEAIRIKLFEFCSNVKELGQFYQEEIALLDYALEEPPPLHI